MTVSATTHVSVLSVPLISYSVFQLLDDFQVNNRKKKCYEYNQTLTSFKPFPKQALVFTCLQYKSLENIVGK